MGLRKRILLPLIGGGLMVGLAVSWVLYDPNSRSAKDMLTAFDKYCLARMTGREEGDPQANGFVRFDAFASNAWTHIKTGLVVQQEHDNCTINLRPPFALTEGGLPELLDRLALHAAAFGLPEVPEITPTSDTTNIWFHMVGRFAEPERWGVFVIQFPATELEPIQTMLTIAYPQATPAPQPTD